MTIIVPGGESTAKVGGMEPELERDQFSQKVIELTFNFEELRCLPEKGQALIVSFNEGRITDFEIVETGL